MGLLDKLFGVPEQQAPLPERPAPRRVPTTPTGVYAPCDGRLVGMANLPDRVIATGALGPAVGVVPAEGMVFAPVSGTVTMTTATLHALGLVSDGGIEVLIHAGVDTVNLKGRGFCGFVAQGQHVEAGEPLMTMDLDVVAAAGYSDVVITVVTNAHAFAAVTCAPEGEVRAGDQVMSVVA